MPLPLVAIAGMTIARTLATRLGPRTISALKKMDKTKARNLINKAKNAIKSKDTKKLENINQQIKKIDKQKGPKNVEAGPSVNQLKRIKTKETKLQKEKTAIAKRKEARKKKVASTVDLASRASLLPLIKRRKKEDKPVDNTKTETKTKSKELAPPTTSKTVTVKKGDTLSDIAKRTKNLTIGDLLELNTNIKNPNQIKIGQKININKPKEEKRKSVYEGFNKKQMEALDADAKGELSKLGIKEITSDSYIPPQKKKAGGPLRPIPAGSKGLPNLPTPVRNKMGFKKRGGRVVKRAVGGGVALRGLGAVRKV
jgi:LysM repeat protein